MLFNQLRKTPTSIKKTKAIEMSPARSYLQWREERDVSTELLNKEEAQLKTLNQDTNHEEFGINSSFGYKKRFTHLYHQKHSNNEQNQTQKHIRRLRPENISIIQKQTRNREQVSLENLLSRNSRKIFIFLIDFVILNNGTASGKN